MNVIGMHDYFSVTEITWEVVRVQQVEYWPKKRSLYHSVRHWSAVTVHYTLRAVTQLIPKLVRVNPVPPEFLQERIMRNAVRAFERICRC